MDLTKEEKQVIQIEGKVYALESSVHDIRADLRSLRNAVMVVSLAAVGAMAVLVNQMHNLTIEIREVAHRQELLGNDLKNEQALIRKDIKSIDDKLDTLINKKAP